MKFIFFIFCPAFLFAASGDMPGESRRFQMVEAACMRTPTLPRWDLDKQKCVCHKGSCGDGTECVNGECKLKCKAPGKPHRDSAGNCVECWSEDHCSDKGSNQVCEKGRCVTIFFEG